MSRVLDAATFRCALGDELRAARAARGLVRRDVAERLQPPVSLNALATWETGTRHITLIRLVEICLVLEVSPMEILRRAHERIFPEPPVTWLVDLTEAARLESPELAPLRNWAVSELRHARLGGRKTVLLDRAAVEPLAVLCGLEWWDLVHRLPTGQEP